MHRAIDDRLLFSATVKCVLMDLEARRAAPIDEGLRNAMAHFMVGA